MCRSLKLLFLLAGLGAPPCAWGFVELRGFVPPGISEGVVEYEYTRIYRLLAPGAPVDRAPLVVTYFTRTATAHEAYSLPEWGGGGAIGTDRIIVAVDVSPLFEQNFLQTTIHELAHIVIGRIMGGVEVPRWFHEGVAMTVSRDLSFQENVVLSQALFTGSLMSMASIDSVNGFGPFRARLAYAQSRQAVRFLGETYGIETLGMITAQGRRSGSFARGLHAVVGIDTRELERLVEGFISQRYGPLFWLVDTYVLWLGIVGLAIAAYVAVMIRRRRRAAALEREEASAPRGEEEGGAADSIDRGQP